MMGRLSALAICAALLSGCATITAESTMLSDNTAHISAVGTSATEGAQMLDAALREAATIASAHGYPYFTVLTADNTSTTQKVRVPGQKWIIEMPELRGLTARSFTVADYAGGNYTTPDETITRFRPGLDLVIQMYRQGEIDPSQDGVWNSDVVLGRLMSAQK